MRHCKASCLLWATCTYHDGERWVYRSLLQSTNYKMAEKNYGLVGMWDIHVMTWCGRFWASAQSRCSILGRTDNRECLDASTDCMALVRYPHVDYGPYIDHYIRLPQPLLNAMPYKGRAKLPTQHSYCVHRPQLRDHVVGEHLNLSAWCLTMRESVQVHFRMCQSMGYPGQIHQL